MGRGALIAPQAEGARSKRVLGPRLTITSGEFMRKDFPLHDLQDAATAFNQSLPPMEPLAPEAEGALFTALTDDLSVVPDWWFRSSLGAITADPARAGDLLRRLLHDRMRLLGTVAEEDALDLPFDAETGAPGTEAPAPPPKLLEALLRAGRGERVHPRCALLPDLSRCDCPEHTHSAKQQFEPKPRLTGWRKLATTDPVTITAWWTRWPEATVGVAGGSNRQGAGGFSRKPRDAAIRLLMELVEDQPTHTSHVKAIRRVAADNGLSWRTVLRAKEEMGIESRIEVGGGFQYWVWFWPAQAQRAFMERGAGDMDLTARYLQERQD